MIKRAVAYTIARLKEPSTVGHVILGAGAAAHMAKHGFDPTQFATYSDHIIGLSVFLAGVVGAALPDSYTTPPQGGSQQ